MLNNTTQDKEQEFSNCGAVGPRSNPLNTSVLRCLVPVLIVTALKIK